VRRDNQDRAGCRSHGLEVNRAPRNVARLTIKHKSPDENIARHDRRPCFFRYPGINAIEPIAAEPNRNAGSSLSETPISEANPANESSMGPATQCTKHNAAISMPARSLRDLSGDDPFICQDISASSSLSVVFSDQRTGCGLSGMSWSAAGGEH